MSETTITREGFSFPQPQRGRLYEVLRRLGEAAIRTQKITEHGGALAAQNECLRAIEALVTEALAGRPTPQTGALAKLAEIPPVGSEERDFWLEAARNHGFSAPREDGSEGNPPWLAWPNAILTLMSEARKQGQRDVLDAFATKAPAEASASRELEAIDRAFNLPKHMSAGERLARIESKIETAYEAEGDALNRAEKAEEALDNCAEAVAFFDQVKRSSPAEQVAVGSDHWNWLEKACREAAAFATGGVPNMSELPTRAGNVLSKRPDVDTSAASTASGGVSGSVGEGTRDDAECRCVGTFGPDPECGACGGSGCVGDLGDLGDPQAAQRNRAAMMRLFDPAR